jgi:hypothetical protein
MDVLNFISWLKSKRQVTTVDASQTLIPVGLKDARRKDGYLPGAISVEDFMALTPGLPSFIEYDETNKTLWNNGFNNDPSSLSYGSYALQDSTGSSNTGIGYFALFNNSYSFNTAVGHYALKSSYGEENVAIGYNALQNNTASYCVGIGSNSLGANSVGNQGARNTGIGAETMGYITTGNFNTGTGSASLIAVTTGTSNTGFGYAAGGGITVGSHNTFLGAFSSADSSNISGSIVIGRDARTTASNQFVVGSSAYNAGAIATEALTPTASWTVRINGVNYKIPLQVA